MNLRTSITVGIDAEGKFSCLYVGDDAAAAKAALENLPAEIVQAEVYRRPDPWKRRKVPAGRATEGQAGAEGATKESSLEPAEAGTPNGGEGKTPEQESSPDGPQAAAEKKKGKKAK